MRAVAEILALVFLAGGLSGGALVWWIWERRIARYAAQNFAPLEQHDELKQDARARHGAVGIDY